MGEQAPGGYHYPEPAHPPAEARPTEDPAPAAGEPFRREVPARRKSIPAPRDRGHWRLITVTVMCTMVIGGSADYVSPGTRASAHVVFWAVIALAALVALYREQRNSWEPSPRWPWPAAAVAGTLTAEFLIATVGSPAIIVGSVVLLVLGLFLVLMFG
ncbi:MAG: hypothetical protein M0026_16335 [Nocardiopsaceae bacterium]|nr:hypothetical protein [Nocardiopsaceae bacterium]